MSFGVDEEKIGRKWVFRAVSVGGLVAVFAGIGMFMGKGNTTLAIVLLFVGLAFGIFFSWSWTGSIFGSLAIAKRYVEGVEGDGRHEWYGFKGQRVRVFLDERNGPWFPVGEIAHILGIKDGNEAFRHYGPREYGTPEFAPEACLSESGLRRLIKYSSHHDAPALGVWLDREVLRMIGNRRER